MNSRELFENALNSEPVFSGYDMNHLSMMGDLFGRYPIIFKKMYKAFGSMKNSITYEPETGPSVEVILDRELNEIKICRESLEISLAFDIFLQFLGLIDTCYTEILPIGSIVELDLDFIPEKIKKSVENSNKGINVMILAQKSSPENHDNAFADYTATLWPYGLQKYSPPFFISNFMIKNTIHKGMSNDTEKEYVDSLRERIVSHRMRSFMYLTKEELKKTAVMSAGKEDKTNV